MPSSFMIACLSESLTYPPVAKRMSTMFPGARRRSRKMTIDIPSRVTTAIPRRCATYVRVAASPRAVLLVQPDLLHPAVVVDVVVRDQVLHVRPLGVVVEAPAHHRPGRVDLELLLDLRHQREPLLRVELLRLLVDLLHELLVAVP